MVSNSRQWQAFSDYIDDTITQYHSVIEQSDDAVTLHRAQGSIAALRKLKYLKDEVGQ